MKGVVGKNLLVEYECQKKIRASSNSGTHHCGGFWTEKVSKGGLGKKISYLRLTMGEGGGLGEIWKDEGEGQLYNKLLVLPGSKQTFE